MAVNIADWQMLQPFKCLGTNIHYNLVSNLVVDVVHQPLSQGCHSYRRPNFP